MNSNSSDILLKLLFLFGLLLMGCQKGELSNLDTDLNRVTAQCGPETQTLGSSYQYFRFLDQEGTIIPMNEIAFGNIGSKYEKKDLKAVGNCLAILKSSTLNHFVYTFFKDKKFGNVLSKDILKEAVKLNNIKLPQLYVDPDHLINCGLGGSKEKNRTIAIKFGFDPSYKKDKSFKNYQIEVSHIGKIDSSFKLNRFNCLYIADEDKEKVIEVTDKSDGEIIFRRPINIWTDWESSDLDKTQVTICARGIYKLDGSCLSHFQYYCGQMEVLLRKHYNLIDPLRIFDDEKIDKKKCKHIEKVYRSSSSFFPSRNKNKFSLESYFYFDNWEDIELSNNAIDDLSPFKYLKNLRELILPDNYITDVSPLVALPNLEILDLSNNKIENYSPINRISSLKKLKLELNEIKEISFVSNLTNLTHLNLFINQIVDTAPLSGLTNLIELELSGNKIDKISFGEEMNNLEKLSLGLNNIRKIESLKGMVSLKFVNLVYNKISDISPLEKLLNLEEIVLGANNISEIKFLKKLTKLKYLNFYDNDIADISVLGNKLDLVGINFRENKISDISALKNLNNLEDVQFATNNIKTITPLKDLKLINNMAMSYNPLGTTIGKTELNCPTDAASKAVSDWCKEKFFN